MTQQRRGGGGADFGDRLSDYVQVNERIVAFREEYPEGSLQSEIIELNDTMVVMRAFAYRTAEDARPGIGTSSLAIPGTTPYTRGSEIENCETSAWGRALAALGFEVKRGIASHEEVRNKQRDDTPTRDVDADRTPAPMQPRKPVLGSVDAPAAIPEDGLALLNWALKEHKMQRPAVLKILAVDTIAEVTDFEAARTKIILTLTGSGNQEP